MGTIANEFVTIEYETKDQELTAKKYLEVFNCNKVLYKGILNGKTIIHSNELISIPEYLLEKPPKYLYYLVTNNILEIINVNKTFSYLPCTHEILSDILLVLLTKIEETNIPEDRFSNIYYQLAYYYCNKEKDFKYLSKYLFDEKLDINDLYELCKSIILNHYNDLIKEQISFEEKNYGVSYQVYENYDEIIKALPQMLKYLDSSVQEIYSSIDSLGIDESSKDEYTYILSNKDKERLIVGALKYIDPSGYLLKEYRIEKKENRIHDGNNMIFYNQIMPVFGKGMKNMFYKLPDGEYGIILFPNNNIKDIIDFMHEYGHLHEYVSNTYLGVSELLSEFASIYFEIKTVEFLINCGFQKEIVDLVESVRTDSNLEHAVYLYPILSNNKGIDDTNYFDNLFPKQVKSYIQKVIYDLTKDSDTIHNLNCESTNIATGIIYFFCTFLATYAANNFESEEVLSIIEGDILDDENIHNILKLLGISKEKSSTKKNKVKINKPTK